MGGILLARTIADLQFRLGAAPVQLLLQLLLPLLPLCRVPQRAAGKGLAAFPTRENPKRAAHLTPAILVR